MRNITFLLALCLSIGLSGAAWAETIAVQCNLKFESLMVYDGKRFSKDKDSGKIVKFMGDAVLLYFETCTDAVKISMRLTRKLEDAFLKIEKVKIRATIGVHAGDVYIGTL